MFLAMLSRAGLLLTLQTPGVMIDTTLAVDPSALLQIHNRVGAIRVAAWERAEIRIRATLPTGERFNLERKGAGLEVQRIVRPGTTRPVDIEVTVPASALLQLDGLYTSFTITGVAGRIRINGTDGDVRVAGGRNGVEVRVVNGAVTVAGAAGGLSLRSTSGAIIVENPSGEVLAETTSGDIRVLGGTVTRLEARTLSGMLEMDTPVVGGSSYILSAHSGNVTATLPANTDANVTMLTQVGRLAVEWPGQPRATQRQVSLTLGRGGATLELESFEGTVRLKPRVLAP